MSGKGKQHPPLSDNVVQGVQRLPLIQSLHSVVLVLEIGTLHFPHEHLKVSELLQQRLMCQELNVLSIVVSLVSSAAFVDLLQILRFMRIDALQNTQPTIQINHI